MSKPIISVVLGSFNRLNFLKLTIESIRKEMQNYSSEIIIIDGGSSDGTLNWLKEQKDIITIVQHNRGKWNGKKLEQKPWGYFMNLGFKCAQGKYICMLSDDCLVVPGAIINGYNLFEEKEKQKIGAIPFYFRNWSAQQKYYVGNPCGNKFYVNHGLYLKQALEDVSYIDEKTFKFYCADIDLCFKMYQKGYSIIPSENSYIEHYPHATLKVRKQNNQKGTQDLINFRKKWQPVYPEIDNHNVGCIKEKAFEDQYQTGKLFKAIHKDIVKSNPKEFQLPSFKTKLYWAIKWHTKSLKKYLN
jgi:glycosyltransferase involved in cell wall biosynthesis